MAAEPLKPCPFCGSTDLEVLAFEVSCKVCDAIGPDPTKRVGTAEELWNERTAGGDV